MRVGGGPGVGELARRGDGAVQHLDECAAALLAGLAHQQQRVERLAAGGVLDLVVDLREERRVYDAARVQDHDDALVRLAEQLQVGALGRGELVVARAGRAVRAFARVPRHDEDRGVGGGCGRDAGGGQRLLDGGVVDARAERTAGGARVLGVVRLRHRGPVGIARRDLVARVRESLTGGDRVPVVDVAGARAPLTVLYAPTPNSATFPLREIGSA